MTAFRLLYFRDAVLADREMLEAGDVVEAVQHASAKDTGAYSRDLVGRDEGGDYTTFNFRPTITAGLA